MTLQEMAQGPIMGFPGTKGVIVVQLFYSGLPQASVLQIPSATAQENQDQYLSLCCAQKLPHRENQST